MPLIMCGFSLTLGPTNDKISVLYERVIRPSIIYE